MLNYIKNPNSLKEIYIRLMITCTYYTIRSNI